MGNVLSIIIRRIRAAMTGNMISDSAPPSPAEPTPSPPQDALGSIASERIPSPSPEKVSSPPPEKVPTPLPEQASSPLPEKVISPPEDTGVHTGTKPDKSSDRIPTPVHIKVEYDFKKYDLDSILQASMSRRSEQTSSITPSKNVARSADSDTISPQFEGSIPWSALKELERELSKWPELVAILPLLGEVGGQIAGGFVASALMGTPYGDIDIWIPYGSRKMISDALLHAGALRAGEFSLHFESSVDARLAWKSSLRLRSRVESKRRRGAMAKKKIERLKDVIAKGDIPPVEESGFVAWARKHGFQGLEGWYHHKQRCTDGDDDDDENEDERKFDPQELIDAYGQRNSGRLARWVHTIEQFTAVGAQETAAGAWCEHPLPKFFHPLNANKDVYRAFNRRWCAVCDARSGGDAEVAAGISTTVSHKQKTSRGCAECKYANLDLQTCIRGVLKQVHPNYSMTMACRWFIVDVLDRLCDRLMDVILQGPPEEAITAKSIEEASASVLTGELHRIAVKEITKITAKYSAALAASASSNTPPAESSCVWPDQPVPKKLVNLVFDPEIFFHAMNRMCASRRSPIAVPCATGASADECAPDARSVMREASIAMAAWAEYICAELLELGGNAARDNKRVRILPDHVRFEMNNDLELYTMLGGLCVGNEYWSPLTVEDAPPETATGADHPKSRPLKIQLLELVPGSVVADAVECFDLSCCCVGLTVVETKREVDNQKESRSLRLRVGGSGVIDAFSKRARWTDAAVAELKSLERSYRYSAIDQSWCTDYFRTLMRAVKYAARGVELDFRGWLAAWEGSGADPTSLDCTGGKSEQKAAKLIPVQTRERELAVLVPQAIAAHSAHVAGISDSKSKLSQPPHCCEGDSVAFVLACKAAPALAMTLFDRYKDQFPEAVLQLASKISDEKCLDKVLDQLSNYQEQPGLEDDAKSTI
jgi:hypothetical protein